MGMRRAKSIWRVVARREGEERSADLEYVCETMRLRMECGSEGAVLNMLGTLQGQTMRRHLDVNIILGSVPVEREL